MPPHGFAAPAALPFLTATFASTLICDDVGLIRIPDMQFVVVVIDWTHPRTLAMNRTPSAWNRCTTPGPRMPTLLWPFVLMPMSVATDVPLHPTAGSAGPVMVKPFRLKTMFGAPNAMHGPPVTLHVKSLTNRVFFESINVSADCAADVSGMHGTTGEPHDVSDDTTRHEPSH